MTSGEFRAMLEKAIQGDPAAFMELVNLYEPLIQKYSYVDGVLDEDLQQHLLMYFMLHISKFEIKYDTNNSIKEK